MSPMHDTLKATVMSSYKKKKRIPPLPHADDIAYYLIGEQFSLQMVVNCFIGSNVV